MKIFPVFSSAFAFQYCLKAGKRYAVAHFTPHSAKEKFQYVYLQVEEPSNRLYEFKAINRLNFYLALVYGPGDVAHSQKIAPEHDFLPTNHAILEPESFEISPEYIYGPRY